MTEVPGALAAPVPTRGPHRARRSWSETGAQVGLRLGWAVGPHLSDPAVRRLARVIGSLGVRRGGAPIEQLRENLRGLTGHEPSPALVEAAVTSWARNLIETFALPGWSPERILAKVSVSTDGPLRAAVAQRGAVVALPHSGNWDLAGAWACLTGMPVTTVAEELSGDAEFARFLAARERLGMTVHGHREPAVLQRLVAAAQPGQVVCLVADRDLVGSGLAVRWGIGPEAPTVTMPAGPALVARRSGAALFGMVARFTRTGIAMHIGPEIETRPGRAGLTEMTQQVADLFARRLARSPQDWHVLVPFFCDARTPDPPSARRGGQPGGRSGDQSGH